MLKVLIFVGLSGMATGYDAPIVTHTSPLTIGPDMVEHGGGCRRSSPPGQCCHMDNRVGKVHCH